jgi:hypothetical protein
MPAKFVSNQDETIRLFKNPVLEYFSHIHPITPVIVFVPAAGICLYRAVHIIKWLDISLAFLAGIFSWTLLEYILHRFIFHYHPRSEWGKKIHFLSHGIHHDYPRDSTRLVMPLLISLPLAALFYILYHIATGIYADAAFAGMISGYVAYDSIHYATHHLPLKSRLGRFLKQYHLRHHFMDDTRSFGVSSPLWDYIFRTNPTQNNPQKRQS